MILSKSELAVDGGSPVRDTPWPMRFSVGVKEKEAVMSIFDDCIATGASPGYQKGREEKLCEAFSEFMGGGYADGVNSGTTAVYVALRSLDLEPHGEIVYSCINDPGGVMPIALQNQIPVPADTASGTYNTNAEQIESRITPLTRAIIVAHIGGDPIDMDAVMAVANKHNLPVIEDCSQSHGAKWNGKMVGSFGEVAAFSTMFGKHFCTGGQGGIVFTKSEERYNKVRQAADRGKAFGLPVGSGNCMASLNFNLSEISAAIGIIQLEKLPDMIYNRRRNMARLRDGLRNLKTISIPEETAGAESSCWWAHPRFHADQSSVDKRTYCEAMGKEGLIAIFEDYRCLPHLDDWFVNCNVFAGSNLPWSSADYKGDADKTYECPNADVITTEQFNVACHENMTKGDIDDMIEIFTLSSHGA